MCQIFKEDTIGKYTDKKRQSKTDTGTTVRNLPGMLRPRSARKTDIGAPRIKALGPGCYPQEDQGCCAGSSIRKQNSGTEKINRSVRATSESTKRTGRDKRCSIGDRARICLAKKKSELGIQGALKGHFSKEVKTAVNNAINEAVSAGMTRTEACDIFCLDTRKFRRWVSPKVHRQRTAWNKILPEEKQAILATAYDETLADKPMSHLMVYGHTSEQFIASISTISRVFKEASIPREVKVRKRSTPYVDAHKLLDNGFSLLCYDGTQFDTDSGIIVWGIPVLLLPQRYLLGVSHSLGSVSSSDLTRAVDEALLSLPHHILDMLVAHSDRGSAMKADNTKEHLHESYGIPTHFGRPHTPDDEGWIEAFIGTMKYHRDCPSRFSQVDDVLQWFNKFPDIYNNDPHSSLNYVTPLQALRGEMEVILENRKQNYIDARNKRLYNYHVNKSLPCKQVQKVVCLSTSGHIR